MSSHSSRDIYAETLAVFDRGDPYEPHTTPEVAAALDANRRTVYKRLQKLVERGELRTKEAGAHARVWWRPVPGRPGTEEGEAQFRSLVQAVEEYAIFMLDSDGYIVSWNDGAECIKGYERDEIVGEHISTFYTDEAVADGVPERNLAAAEAEGSTEDEGWRIRKDGSRFWANVTITAVRDDEGDLRGYTKVTRDMTERRAYERQLERQRDALRQELDEVYERIDDAVYALDGEWRFTHVNERAERLLGHTEEELLGEVIWEEFSEAVGMNVYRNYHDAMETQETVRFEEYFPPHDRWYDVRVYPSETGLSAHFLDVTERKEREQDLEQYETVVETVTDGVYAVDEQYRFTMVNDAYVEMTGYDREELLGRHVSTVVDDDVVEVGERRRETLLDGDADSGRIEVEIETADGEQLTVESRYSLLPFDDEFRGSVGVVRDVTERKERERELERYGTIIEAMDDPVYALDAQGRFTFVNRALADRSGYDEAELLGQSVSIGMEDEAIARTVSVITDLLADDPEGSVTIEYDVIPKDGDTIPVENNLSLLLDEDGQFRGSAGVLRDITDRKERERELEARIRQQDVVADLGQQALETHDVDALMAEAVELVADTLDNDYCEVLDLDADAEELLFRHGVGWDDGVVGSTTVSATDTDSQAAYTLASNHPVVVTDRPTDSRFSGPDLLASHDVRSGVSTIIGPDDDPWGILATHDTACKEFAEQDVNFVQAIANILATAIERHTYERELTRQHEHLAALNNLNRVVREITDTVIDQSTRGEIEQVVCEQLAASDSYKFAWVAGIDRQTERILPRAEAGIEAFLATIDLSADPDERIGQGPAGKTFRTGELRVSRDVFRDPAFEPWRHNARKYGFRSFASIPIVHEDTLYGVIGVYSERAGAFAPEEREVIGQLGEVVGHAIAAVEQKQALMSNEIVELAFQYRDIFDSLDVSASVEGTVTLDRAVPLGDGAFLVYGTATDDAMAVVEALVDAETVPHWESVTVIGVEGDTSTFEVRLTDPPVLSTIAAQGGYIHEATIEDGDFYLEYHLAPSADVGHVIDSITEAYPAAEMVTRHQTTRSDQSPAQLEGVLSARLTRRQRAALEAGYFAGYFEWPRASSGEDVAESLDISSSTFHQHLRKAEKKLLDTVFGQS